MYRVLVHTFNTWEEMSAYMLNIAKKGNCKSLPKVTQFSLDKNGKAIKGWQWQPYINELGELRFN